VVNKNEFFVINVESVPSQTARNYFRKNCYQSITPTTWKLMVTRVGEAAATKGRSSGWEENHDACQGLMGDANKQENHLWRKW
jgi:hypothetical protein